MAARRDDARAADSRSEMDVLVKRALVARDVGVKDDENSPLATMEISHLVGGLLDLVLFVVGDRRSASTCWLGRLSVEVAGGRSRAQLAADALTGLSDRAAAHVPRGASHNGF
jgi:hypothetical protein